MPSQETSLHCSLTERRSQVTGVYYYHCELINQWMGGRRFRMQCAVRASQKRRSKNRLLLPGLFLPLCVICWRPKWTFSLSAWSQAANTARDRQHRTDRDQGHRHGPEDVRRCDSRCCDSLFEQMDARGGRCNND